MATKIQQSLALSYEYGMGEMGKGKTLRGVNN